MATDTAFMASPVISYLELLVPNGRHDFEQVFYTEGTNPIVEPEPDDPDPDSDNPDESDIPKIVPGQSLDFVDLIIGGGQTCEPDGVGKGHWGGGIKPIVGPPLFPLGIYPSWKVMVGITSPIWTVLDSQHLIPADSRYH